MDVLLHSENIIRIPLLGSLAVSKLVKRIDETRSAAKDHADPGVSIVIRSKDNARQLEGLLEDIRLQDYHGAVEIIVVDTESRDETVKIAHKFGTKLLSISQAEFNYPKALNLGFKAATKPWVFSCVDHSAFSSRYVLKTISRWDSDPRIAGIWSFTLPNANATIWERIGYMFWVWRGLDLAHETRKSEKGMGFLGANDMAVRRNVWQKVGGFDEHYAAGAEDLALGRAIIQAGYKIVYDPSLAVHHTHGLGLRASWRQFRYWRRVMKPQPFNVSELRRYRSDL
jgi:rhamnosyltransferase